MADPMTPPRAPWHKTRGTQIALALSVTLNLVVAGIVAGAVLRGPPDHGPKDREFSFGPFSQAMTPEQRRDLRQQILKASPDLRQTKQEMRDDLGRVVAALRAKPFDAKVFADLMEAQHTRLAEQIAIGSKALSSFLMAMDDAQRLEFADRLEQRLKHKGMDRPPAAP